MIIIIMVSFITSIIIIFSFNTRNTVGREGYWCVHEYISTFLQSPPGVGGEIAGVVGWGHSCEEVVT